MSSSRTMLLLLLMGACSSPPPGSSEPAGTPSDPVRVCAKEGQNCVFGEGKLGLCSAKLGCTGDARACLVCMSLH